MKLLVYFNNLINRPIFTCLFYHLLPRCCTVTELLYVVATKQMWTYAFIMSRKQIRRGRRRNTESNHGTDSQTWLSWRECRPIFIQYQTPLLPLNIEVWLNRMCNIKSILRFVFKLRLDLSSVLIDANNHWTWIDFKLLVKLPEFIILNIAQKLHYRKKCFKSITSCLCTYSKQESRWVKSFSFIQ
jgi:hypothetical protein